MQDGHTFYAYLPGGASGGIHRPWVNILDFDVAAAWMLHRLGCGDRVVAA
jgi:hypothetical protein